MTKEELRARIRTLYSEIWNCGFDVSVEWDDVEKTWIVELNRHDREGKQLVALGGLELEPLRPNIGRTQA